HNVLRRLGETLYQPNDTAARFQCLRQKHRQHRIEHFRRGISKETRRGEQERIPREPGEVSFHACATPLVYPVDTVILRPRISLNPSPAAEHSAVTDRPSTYSEYAARNASRPRKCRKLHRSLKLCSTY